MRLAFAALGGAVGATVRCWRLVLVLWVINAAVAWVLVSPLGDALSSTWRRAPIADGLLTSFDNEAWIDFGNTHGSSIDAVEDASRTIVLPWIVLWTILSGGVLARLAGTERRLLRACGRYAHRLLWLLATTLLALWGVHLLNEPVTRAVTGWLVGDDSSASAGRLGWSMTGKTVLMLAVTGLVTTTGNLARVRVVVRDERLAPMSWLATFASVLRHLPGVAVARILSYWPLVLALGVHVVLAGPLLADDRLLPGMRTPWRMVLLFQAVQLLVQAALVYRMAVDVRLWPLLSPGDDASDSAEPEGPAAESSSNGRLAAALAVLALAAFAPGQTPPPAEVPPPAGIAPAGPTPDDAAVHRNAYLLDVTIDLAGHTATCSGEATFLNTTSQPVATLWMHLYPAAFANTRSVWMSAGRRSGPETITARGAEDGGYVDVRRLALADGTDLAGRATIEDTLMRVDLPEPVAAGGRVTLSLDWVTRFPRIIARMGMRGLHLDGMQWFPKFCAHDESGWRNRPFYATGEFFADFGSYDVTLRWPEAVGGRAVTLEATGVPGETVGAGTGTLARRYRARDVHDFAFCADPSFRRHEASVALPGTDRSVDVVYLCQPYAEPKADVVLDVVRTCLERSARWWMPYPYPRLVVDGLPHGLGGGMEYPMLFTISQNQPNHIGSLVSLWEDPASVTAHEFTHQYFYGLLASDEVEEAWLDEGFTTYGTTKLLEAHWPDGGRTDALTFLGRQAVVDALNGAVRGRLPGAGDVLSLQQVIGWRTSPFHDVPPDEPRGAPTLLGFRVPGVRSLRLPDMSANRPAWNKLRFTRSATLRPLRAPSREFSRGYGPLVYSKSALVLQTLENHLGSEAMRELLGDYVRTWAFRHPSTDDFLALASRHTGGELDGLLSQLVETARTVDWTVDEVSTRRVKAPVGYLPQTRPGDPVVWSDGAEGDGGDGPGRPWWERAWSAVFTTPFPGTAEDPEPDDGAGAAGANGGPAADGDDGPAGGDAASAASSDDDAPGEPGDEADNDTMWVSRWVVRQRGQVEAPVVVEARFADGHVLRETWDGRGGYHIREVRHPARLVEVVADPDRLYAIDLDVNNNGRRTRPADETPRTLRAAAHFGRQLWLDAWALAF